MMMVFSVIQNLFGPVHFDVASIAFEILSKISLAIVYTPPLRRP